MRRRSAVLLPIQDAATRAAEFWSDANVLMTALSQNFPTISRRVLPELHSMAEAWERHWNAMLAHAETGDGIIREDQSGIHIVDRRWAEFVNEHRVDRGFILHPATMARLL